MDQLLTDQSLKEFVEMIELPKEKREEYLAIIAKLNEEGRSLLFDTLTNYYIIGEEQKKTEKALECLRDFAQDADYVKLTKNFDDLDNTL